MKQNRNKQPQSDSADRQIIATEAHPAVEHHPLEPFLPAGAKILLLGSFPPKQARWSMNFFYPNLQNDMWRIMGLIFFGDKSHFVEHKRFDEARIREFCTARGIAIGDTARAVVRLNDNAADKFLEIVERVDLDQVLQQIPDCHAIVTTGQKATDSLLHILSQTSGEVTEPKVGSFTAFTYKGRNMKLYRMPSSSRAYPKPVEEKAVAYRTAFAETGVL